MPRPLSPEDNQALYQLSKYSEFWVLKKVLQNWIGEVANVADIDLNQSIDVIAGTVAGKHETAKHLATLLESLSASAPPRVPKIDTHE